MTNASRDGSVDADRYRLPRTVVPSHYRLTLEPDLDAATFAGSGSVTVAVTETIGEVVLNALDLDITEAWLEAPDGTRLDATVSYDAEAERATLTLATDAQPGPHTVHTSFTGELNDKLVGFYRSTYTGEDGDGDDGEEQVIATTQFEATHARRAFPCWDEPDLKASFSITLVVPEDLMAVSNAAQVASDPRPNGARAVRFADTMVMSTYLVAFVVGRLEATEPRDADGTAVRIVHLPGKGHLTGFALDVAARALAFYADYYGIAYPGDKLDLLAIPDFAFGAMENLGCVTFREVLLLIDPDHADQPELERVADVINHELAHMWFGDLVTMRWWNGIWLNEAFATFMEMLATDAYRPEWDRWTSFGISRTAAFDTDALAATRPIEFPVISPVEAEGMFDILTYEKGSAVVRMLEQYLGADEFRKGIDGYLHAHQYANTETTDLWDAIESATGQPTRRIMDSWIFQGGFPVVSAELVGAGRTVRLSQERFRYTPRADTEATHWSVPVLLQVSTDGGATHLEKVLLEGPSTDVTLDAAPDAVVVNAGGSGFFRVRYSADLRAALTERLDRLTPLERYGLVDDAWASTVAGTTDIAELLALVRAFAGETDLSVWQRVIGVLGALDRLVDDAHRSAFEGLVRSLLGPAWERLGPDPVDGEPERTTALRASLFRALGTLGADAHVRARAAELAARADAGEPAPTSLVNAAVDVLAGPGDHARFDAYLDHSQRAGTPQDRLRYLGALADFDDPNQTQRLLDLVLSPEVRSQDGPLLLRRGLNNRVNGAAVWAFVKEHWDQINERFPTMSIPRILEGVRVLSQPDTAHDVEAFLAEHPVPQGAKQVAQHVERLRVNVALRERVAAPLADALA